MECNGAYHGGVVVDCVGGKFLECVEDFLEEGFHAGVEVFCCWGVASYWDGVEFDLVDLAVSLEFCFKDAVVVVFYGVGWAVSKGEVAVDGCDDVVCCGVYGDGDGDEI